MYVTVIVLLQAAYRNTLEIGVVVGRQVGVVLLPISKISVFTGKDRQYEIFYYIVVDIAN